MKVTIVTLSFNQRPLLQRTLNSVLDQRCPALEYIVVDPGSTDGSREIIETYQTRLAAVIFEPDRGPADGLNKGFALASGDVYGFLNADDVLLPGSLDRVCHHFAAHPECDVLMGNGFVVDAQDHVLRHVRAQRFTPDRYFYAGASWLQQATFFRARAFRAVGGFCVDNRYSWDGELFVKMSARAACFQYLDEDLASLRICGESITTRVQRGASDSVFTAHRAQFHRIFAEVKGRPWRFRDDLWRGGYRLARKIMHPGELAQALLYRARRLR